MMYAAGKTDEVKGTGVYSAFRLKRVKDESDQKSPPNTNDETNGKVDKK